MVTSVTNGSRPALGWIGSVGKSILASADEGDRTGRAKTVSEEIVVPWILLIVAGLLEVGWASALPATHGLTRLVPSLVFGSLLAASMLTLAAAARVIPLGTAYSVWVGIGAVGAAVVGIVRHGDPATPARLVFLGLLVVSVVGLKATAGH